MQTASFISLLVSITRQCVTSGGYLGCSVLGHEPPLPLLLANGRFRAFVLRKQIGKGRLNDVPSIISDFYAQYGSRPHSRCSHSFEDMLLTCQHPNFFYFLRVLVSDAMKFRSKPGRYNAKRKVCGRRMIDPGSYEG